MKEEYKIGSLSKVIQQASKLKEKSSSDKELTKLAELFAPPIKKKVSVAKPQDVAGMTGKSDIKMKNSSTKKQKCETQEALSNQAGYDPPPGEALSNQAGYDPPPGIVHEALIKRNRDGDEESKPSGRKPRHKNRRDRTKDPRTIFVGNLPIAFDKKRLKKLFLPFGAIESLRFRCAPPADLKLPRRAVAITKTFHKDRHNIVSYVCYEEEESAQKALKLNGKEVDGFHIRVDISNNSKKHDKINTVFVGNLTYDITENELWDHFQDLGEIENVRVVRDSKTGMGKGFGYIQFKEKDSVQFALKLHESSLKGRKIRVMRCDAKTALKKKEKMMNKIKPRTGQVKSSGKKISFRSTNKKTDPFHSHSHEKRKHSKKSIHNKRHHQPKDSSKDKKTKKVTNKHRKKIKN